MTEQPEILEDYSITEFLDRDTWKIKYRVEKQPTEENLYFERPIFDTWEEAIMCVCNLRNYPKFYATRMNGKYVEWVEVANV
jgi:hypothetical protein